MEEEQGRRKERRGRGGKDKMRRGIVDLIDERCQVHFLRSRTRQSPFNNIHTHADTHTLMLEVYWVLGGLY